LSVNARIARNRMLHMCPSSHRESLD
jgi:hypothetical protein